MKEELNANAKAKSSTGRGRGKNPCPWPFPPKLLSYPTRPPLTDRSRTRTQQYEDMKTDIGEARW